MEFMICAAATHSADAAIAAVLAQLLKSLFRFSIERKRRARIVNAPHLIDIPRAYPGDDLYEGPIRITMRVCVHVACIHLTADDLSSGAEPVRTPSQLAIQKFYPHLGFQKSKISVGEKLENGRNRRRFVLSY